MGDVKLIDWTARAEAHHRDDGGSDMFYDFKQLRTGPLAEVVRWVRDLPRDERARVIVDAAGLGSLNIHEVNALAARPDFPPG